MSKNFDIKNVKDELDVLFLLYYAISPVFEKKEMPVEEFQVIEKDLIKLAKRLRAKLNHRINPRVFTNIIEASNPVSMVDSTVERFLEAPHEPEIDLTKHGIAQINTEYVYISLDHDDQEDMAIARGHELQVLERCAIAVTMDSGLKHAIVNVKLYPEHGFSGRTHQFEIGE